MTARVLLVLLVALALAAPAAAAPHLVPVPGAYTQPVHMSAPPEDPRRLFVVEKAGIVKVVVDGAQPKVFLDLTAEVDVSPNSEEGLLSIAFAKDHATSRRFYLFLTAEDPAQGDGSMIRIVELVRPEATPDSGEGSTRRTLLEVAHPEYSNHNGGQLQIGPDGMLWLAIGDGTKNPPDAQSAGSRLGKLIRIDPAAPDPPEIYASGLRNPWRFSFDRQTGDLAIGDVGAGTREEIDFLTAGTPAGTNFEWPCREGSGPGPDIPNCVAANGTPPVFDYDNDSEGCGVTGGYVVRDPALPTLFGRYLYGDLCRTTLRSIVLGKPAATDPREEPALDHGGTLDNGGSVVSFGEDSCGHVYVATLKGTVFRVDDGTFVPCGGQGGGDPGGGSSGGGNPGGGSEPGPGGQPPPGPAGDPASTPDIDPPGLTVSRARHQKLLRKKAVYIGARCDEACTVRTESNARLSVGGKLRKYAFPAVSRPVASGERPRLKLRLSKAMRDGLAERMAAGARPLVKVVVVARDTAGNEARRTVYIRVVG